MTPMLDEEGAVSLFQAIEETGEHVRHAVHRVEGFASRVVHRIGGHLHLGRRTPA